MTKDNTESEEELRKYVIEQRMKELRRQFEAQNHKRNEIRKKRKLERQNRRRTR